jgi:L-amino acid N-acyltransferase YncA
MIVRRATVADAGAMTDILNTVIAIGGTTAHEDPKPVETVRRDYIDGPDVLASVVAEEAGRVVGWQSVGLWQGEADIGTFVAPGTQARGAGTAMFALTCAILRDKGHRRITAAIRADNRPGLAYYARIGFVDVTRDAEFALADGRVVGRVHRVFDL